MARRGLEHPDKCPLCDQEEENVQHLLSMCVVARQVWFHVFEPQNLVTAVPRLIERSFADWWRRTIKKKVTKEKKGVNSLII